MAKDLRTYLSSRRTRLPQQIADTDVARQIEEIHSVQQGATFSLYFGDVAGQELYAVSLYPERTARVRGSLVSARRIMVFIAQNRDLLADPRVCIGLWYEADNDVTYLDVTATLPDRTSAIRLGQAYNQIAIYDLAGQRVIDTEGTGEDAVSDVPVTERLPPLIR